jgi:uncharacterized protein YxjI
MEFDLSQTPEQYPMQENTGERFKNVKELKAGDGSFLIRKGRLELRDTAGNIVILLDANG